MRASLTRVAPFVRPYRGRLVLGIAAFGGSRLLEALVPWYLALGIDRIAAGSSDLTLPTFGILLAVIARYGVVTYARYTVRSVGQHVSFDLRAALYAALQRQGATFFARHTIGDMMTRAISDIALIQRLITMGTILVVVLVYATLVGFGFMWTCKHRIVIHSLAPVRVSSNPLNSLDSARHGSRHDAKIKLRILFNQMSKICSPLERDGKSSGHTMRLAPLAIV